MSLRKRLDSLRRQSGAAADRETEPSSPLGDGTRPGPSPPADQQPGNDRRTLGDRTPLADRLRRLQGTAPRAGGAPRGRVVDEEEVAELVGGEILAPGVILRERRVSLHGTHGGFALRRAAEPVRGLPEGDVDPRRVVYLDTETTGLSGGAGTVVFLLGLGRLAGDELVLRQYLLTAFGGEADLLAAAGEWAAGAEWTVTYNGRAFDLPLVAARCRLAGVEDRLGPLEHLDLLAPARRAFGRRWDDCRLTTAERRLLRLERRDDLPGSEAPEAWFAFLRRGDPGRLPLVAEHNHRDVVSLAALLPALDEAHVRPGCCDADILAVARAHARAGARGRALALLRRHRARLEPDGLLELAALLRRQGAWQEAAGIWEELAARGHVEALERLAKYHEHVRRDFAGALDLAERLPAGPDHDRRRARLREKLRRAASVRAPPDY